MIEPLGYFFFLQKKCWFKNMWPFWAVSTHTYSVTDLTHLSYIHLAFSELPCIMGPLEFCVPGVWQMLHMNGVVGNNKYVYFTYLFCSYTCSIIPLDFNYKEREWANIEYIFTERDWSRWNNYAVESTEKQENVGFM